MTGYKQLYILAVVVTVILAMLGGVQLAGGATLGLSPVAIAWLGIIGTGLGVLQGFLPPLQRTPASYDNPGPASDPDPMPRDR